MTDQPSLHVQKNTNGGWAVIQSTMFQQNPAQMIQKTRLFYFAQTCSHTIICKGYNIHPLQKISIIHFRIRALLKH